METTSKIIFKKLPHYYLIFSNIFIDHGLIFFSEKGLIKICQKQLVIIEKIYKSPI